ncbi:MAG: hypothetical protein C0616_01750 [Desulfuromonas sp.]|nr:MAG: hypothetical protein C0616_01750 [Desulfuromonas sp.]
MIERDEGRGRSARKRAAKLVEQHAQQITDLQANDLQGLDLPPNLGEALETARNTKGFSSRKRAVKHLAALLRQDEEAMTIVADFLTGQTTAHWAEQEKFHDLEQWRDRLCQTETADQALTDLINIHPNLATTSLVQLSRAARNGDKAAARKLFRLLRENT